MNNPVMYIDPDGEIAWIVPGIIVGAIAGAYMGGVQANGTYNPFKWDWSSGATWGSLAAGAIIGGVSGAIGGAVGMQVAASVGVSGAMGGAVSGAVGGAVGGFIDGVGMSAFNGSSFSEALTNGLSGAFMGALGGGVLGGVSGGINAKMNGKSFWRGEDKLVGKSINIGSDKSNNASHNNIDQGRSNSMQTYNSSYQELSDIHIPDNLCHYSPENPSNWTKLGLIKDDPIYLTTNPELGIISATNDLSLPTPPNFRMDINVSGTDFDLNKVILVRRVTGNVYTRGGGGWEIIYKGPLNFESSAIKIIRIK